MEENLDYENANAVDVVSVPTETVEVSEEEDIDENIIGEENKEPDIAVYEIQPRSHILYIIPILILYSIFY